MKIKVQSLVALVIFCLSFKAMAYESYRLTSPIDLKVYDRGVMVQLAQLPVGTILEIDQRDRLGPTRFERQNGSIAYSQRGWVGVVNIELARSPRFHSDLEYAYNRFYRPHRGDRFYVSVAIDQLARYLGSTAPRRPAPPVYTPAPVPPRGGVNMYEVCYERPRTQWVTTREDQARAGRRNTAIGAGAAVVGIILGGSNNGDLRNLGTALTIGGAALATVGLVQSSNARSPITVYDQSCETYYTRDTRTRTVMISGQRCVTERYYSRSWNHEVEYFQTTCHGGQRFHSFERHPDFWY